MRGRERAREREKERHRQREGLVAIAKDERMRDDLIGSVAAAELVLPPLTRQSSVLAPLSICVRTY
jgi:hypothetical protein